MAPADAAPERLTGPARGIALVAWGAALWGAGVIVLRLAVPLGALEGSGRALFYAAAIPGTWPFLLLTIALFRLRPGQIVPATAFVTMVALFIDGVVFGWFAWIYGDPATRLDCAAAVLWGAGCGLVLAFAEEARRRR